MPGRDHPSTFPSPSRERRKKVPIGVGVARKGLSSTRTTGKTAGQKRSGRREVMHYVFAPPLPYKRVRIDRTALVLQPSEPQAELRLGGSPNRVETTGLEEAPSLPEEVLSEALAANEPLGTTPRGGPSQSGNPGRMKNTGSPVQEPRKIAGELVAPASTSSAHPVSAASAHFLSPVFSSNSLEPPQALLSTAPRAHCIVSDLHCPHHESGAAVSVPHTSPVAPAPATVSEVAPTLRVAPIPPLDLGNGHGAATLNSGLNSADLRDDSGSGGIHIALSQLEVANAIFDAFGALGLSTVMAIPPPPPLPLPASSHGPLPRPSHHTPSADQPPSGHVGHALSGASPRQTPSNRHNFPPSPLSALPLQPLLSHPASLAAPSTTVRHALPREAFPCQNPSNLQVFSASPPLGAGRVRHDLPRGASLRGSGSGFREIGPGPEPNRTPTTLIEQPAPTGNSRLVASSRRAARGTRVDNYHPLKITRGDLGTDLSDARDETAAVADVDLHDRKEHQNLLPPCASTPDPTLQEQNITTSPLEPKRPHTTSSSVERKEARAHRNRIAAQNSRDRRKAQFSYLERRVSELEEENRRLRAGLFAAPAQQDPRKAEEPECEQAKSRQNEELRERIKTLEKGWDVVTKALATGLSRMGVEID